MDLTLGLGFRQTFVRETCEILETGKYKVIWLISFLRHMMISGWAVSINTSLQSLQRTSLFRSSHGRCSQQVSNVTVFTQPAGYWVVSLSYQAHLAHVFNDWAGKCLNTFSIISVQFERTSECDLSIVLQHKLAVFPSTLVVSFPVCK